jgi:hypothetical protein
MEGVRPAVARVLDAGGEPVGAAFLVTPDIVLTAAHVVSVAAGNGKDGTEQPDGEVILSFAVAADRLLRAEVVHWLPPGAGSPEDIAGLRLLDPLPDGAAPVPLADLRSLMGRRVAMLGFPGDAPHGGWGMAQLAGLDARGFVQVDTLPDSQFTIEEGFSGTPVWDVEDRAVAGLVVEGWTSYRRSGFMVPTAMVLEAWPWLADRIRPVSPFRGLAPFTEHDAAVFFGRDEPVDRIVSLSEKAPVLTVVGPSGIGKSSLLAAGVLPRLRDRTGLVIVTMRPGQARTPLHAVALALARAAAPDADPLSRRDRAEVLADRLARGLVGEVVADVLETRGCERLMLVVDQFEEILITSPDELDQVAAVLAHCLHPQSRLVLLIGLRADFLGQALQHRDLAELVQDTRLVTVGELSRSQLREAIVEPVDRTRLVHYEAGLVDRLLADVGPAPGRLPLLQFTLAMLWDNQESGVLTHRAYDALGSIDSALAGHAESVWNGLGNQERRAAERLLVQLLYPLAASTGFVGRAAARAELDDAQWAAAQRLASDGARLVVVRRREPDEVVELAHDALVTHWQRLRQLGEQDREFREWQEALRQRIRRDGPPLSGADLRDAVRWRTRRGADLSPAERAYLDTRRRQRAVQWVSWAAVAALIAVVAGYGMSERERQRELQVASGASETLVRVAPDDDRYAWLRTILRAYRTSANSTTEVQVGYGYGQYARLDQVLPDYTTPQPSPPGQEPAPFEPIPSVAQKVSADGRTLVATDPQHNLTVWRVEGDRVTGHALGQTATKATVSRDGRYVGYVQNNFFVAIGRGVENACDAEGLSHCVNLYDTVTGQTRRLGIVPTALGEPIIRFDPSGQVLAALFSNDVFEQRLVTWEVAGGAPRDDVIVPVSPPSTEIAAVRDLWLAPGGHRMLLQAAVTRYPWSRLGFDVIASVDLTGPEPVSTEIASSTVHYAVSGDGGRVVALVPVQPSDTGQGPKRPVVWDVATGQRIAEGPALSEEEATGEIALDLHGERVFLTPFGAGTVSLWRVGETGWQPGTLHIGRGWQFVLPLGSGEDTSLLLADGEVVGLALAVPGQPTPLQRLATPPPDLYAQNGRDQFDAWFGEMSAMLASCVPVENERVENLPAGAYSGPLCAQ